MFGIIRPCRNRLGDDLRADWLAHLCGMCLALRDEHGHLARLVTNYDAVVVSALVEAQTGTAGRRRRAGPCALRGMRTASVATGDGAHLAASVSLLLASATIDDHLADGDVEGLVRTRAARAVARRWKAAGTATGTGVALDAGALLDVVAAQAEAEASPASILDVPAPTEAATAAAFGHAAVLAGRPGNVPALEEAGRLFGRVAHLLDAVEDRAADAAAGVWNPITALQVAPQEVRRLCADAVLGVRLALREVDLVDRRLVHVLLVHELASAVHRVFATAERPDAPPASPPPPPAPGADAPPAGWEAPPPSPARNPLAACLGWLVVCGTCQVCCADEYTDPCTGKQRKGSCDRRAPGCDSCDCCCDGCDGCDCCCDACDCGC